MKLDIRSTHPRWCALDRCGATVADGELVGQHRSWPVTTPFPATAIVEATVSLILESTELEASVLLEMVDCASAPDQSFLYRLRPTQGRALRRAFAVVVSQFGESAQSWNGVDHPAWCDVDRCYVVWPHRRSDDGDTEPSAPVHMSRPIACNPRGDEEVQVAVYVRNDKRSSIAASVWVEFARAQDLQAFPLKLEQATRFREMLGSLTRMSTPSMA